MNCYFSGKEIFPDDGSIEHIVSENDGDFALNIGNLILLEVVLNREAGNDPYSNKISIYKKSSYPWIAKFIADHKDWDPNMIAARANELAKIYFQNILGKTLD